MSKTNKLTRLATLTGGTVYVEYVDSTGKWTYGYYARVGQGHFVIVDEDSPYGLRPGDRVVLKRPSIYVDWKVRNVIR